MEDRFLIGYARVSTEDQELRLQIDALKAYGVPANQIITEKKSGKKLKGRKLHEILTDMLRAGDRIVVWRLDRLGRSLKELIQIVEMIDEAGADLVSLRDNIDTSTAGGKLMFHMFGAVAEFERNLTSERTKAGMLARKMEDPDFKPGAKRKIADVQARLDQLQLLYDNREFSIGPKFKQRGRNKGDRCGYTIRGRGNLRPIKDALNACVKEEKPIENTLTISRWMEDGCEGLKLRPDAEMKEP